MTREEFARYVFEGAEWTPATIAAARMAQDGMIPTCDAETFEREVVRPDGIVPFQRDEPLFRASGMHVQWITKDEALAIWPMRSE